jgi:hypothetical protein
MLTSSERLALVTAMKKQIADLETQIREVYKSEMLAQGIEKRRLLSGESQIGVANLIRPKKKIVVNDPLKFDDEMLERNLAVEVKEIRPVRNWESHFEAIKVKKFDEDEQKWVDEYHVVDRDGVVCDWLGVAESDTCTLRVDKCDPLEVFSSFGPNLNEAMSGLMLSSGEEEQEHDREE